LTLYWHFVVILCLRLCAFYCKFVCVCHAINKCNLLTYLLVPFSSYSDLFVKSCWF